MVSQVLKQQSDQRRTWTIWKHNELSCALIPYGWRGPLRRKARTITEDQILQKPTQAY